MGHEGRSIGRYVLYDRIASGGMAQVHLGRLVGAVGFSRTVAIKRLLPHCATDAEIVPMFVDEARLAARIRHPNVVGTLDVVRERDELLLVMEYVHGESLARLLSRARARGERVSTPIAVAIAIAVLEGLHAAHEARSERGEPLGIVHRDVSPQNIIVGADGVPRVVDFGIAKARGRLEKTETGVVKGKFSYMSPEQCLGQPVDRRTDVFACGVCLYELLTRRRLFRRATVPATVRALLDRSIVPVRDLREEVSPRLEKVVLRALERDPSRRYESCAALRRDLLDAVADTGQLDEQLAAEMHALFSDRVEAKRAMVRSLRAGEPVEPVPAEADLHVELTDVTLTAARPKKRGLLVGGGLVALGVAGALLGGLFLFEPNEMPPVAPEAGAEPAERDEPRAGDDAAEPPASDETASTADPVAPPPVPERASEPEGPEPTVGDARPRRNRAVPRVRQREPAAAASAPVEIPQFH